MAPKLPTVTASRLLSALRRHGFEPVRQSGSHVIVEHQDGRRTVVPMHRGRDLPKGTLKQILADTGLGADDITGH